MPAESHHLNIRTPPHFLNSGLTQQHQDKAHLAGFKKLGKILLRK